jgi:arabinose-5-phosphate isomerase
MSVATLTELKTRTPDAGMNAATDALSAARRVLETETAALTQMMSSLGDNFVQAVDLIASAKGRVIVSGMGKSGHVGKKIAATLASTGTPAFFVHPGEASHGDMGMIVQGDVVLALSNSGETGELFDIIGYTRRFAIPLIGITSRAGSTLAQRSDIALLTPPAPEACPNGLAPTTSTTLAIALGDALAVALLERKGFGVRDFKEFHPGGKLGQKILSVSDIMQTGDKIPLARESASMADAVCIMTEKGMGCVVVTDDKGVLSGIITDGDLRRNLFNDKAPTGIPSWLSPSRSRRWKKSMEVREIMSRDPRTIPSTMMVAEAVAIMCDLKNTGRKMTQLVITDADRKPVGILHIHDALRAGFA